MTVAEAVHLCGSCSSSFDFRLAAPPPELGDEHVYVVYSTACSMELSNVTWPLK